jgi:hypothetical protein
MRLTSNLQIRRGSLCAAVIVLASSGAIGPLASAGEPAKLYILSGEVAALLQQQNNPAQPVLRGAAGEDMVVILFDANPERAAELPDELFSTDPVPCSEGVTCCDPKKGVMVVNATYNNQIGWVETGELCEPPDTEPAPLVGVPEELSDELNRSFGIDYCFMEIAAADGSPRVLVNAPSQDSPLWAYCLRTVSDAERTLPAPHRAPAQGGALWLASSIMGRVRLQAPSPIILVADCQRQTPAFCPGIPGTTSAKICVGANDRWYTLNDQNKWCKSSSTCGPC